MKTVYKYPIEIIGEKMVMLPNGFEITLVGLDPNGAPCLWAIVDPERSEVAVKIIIEGTGQPIPINAHHIGSFCQGPFVWHAFITA